MRWVVAILTAAVTLVVTYYAVAYAACTWFWPQSNLCGLIAVPTALAAAMACFLAVVIRWK